MTGPDEPDPQPPAPVVRETTSSLPVPDPVVLQEAAVGPATLAAHHAAVARIPALHAIETRPSAGRPSSSSRPLRLAAWNLERGKHLEASLALLRRSEADVVLLSEMDLGMARSGQRHTTRELADGLGMGYAFGVEFVELGHGIGRELDHAGEANSVGLHGNAILSGPLFADPVLLRLDRTGAWFGRPWHHRRIGGRVALGVTLDVGRPLAVVSTHLENIGTPADRLAQVEPILAWLDIMPRGCPAVVAGDFNTANLPDAGGEDTRWVDHADTYEPLFGAFRAAGFAWQTANRSDHARRLVPDGRPPPKPRRVDWIFTRGVEASDARTWPAADPDGDPISDHDLITVDLVLRD